MPSTYYSHNATSQQSTYMVVCSLRIVSSLLLQRHLQIIEPQVSREVLRHTHARAHTHTLLDFLLDPFRLKHSIHFRVQINTQLLHEF